MTGNYIEDSLELLYGGKVSLQDLKTEVQDIINTIVATSAEDLLTVPNDDLRIYSEDGYPQKYNRQLEKDDKMEEIKKAILDRLYGLRRAYILCGATSPRIKWKGEKTQLVMLARALVDLRLVDENRESLLSHFETKDGPMKGDGSDLLRSKYKGDKLEVIIGSNQASGKYE